MNPAGNAAPHVVVVGCGIAGLSAARALGRRTAGRYRLTVVDRSPTLYNYPVLPRTLLGPVPEHQVAPKLEALLAGYGAELHVSRVTGVCTATRQVHCESGVLDYDVLLLGVGGRAVPIARDGSFPVLFPKAFRHLERLSRLVDEHVRSAAAGGAGRTTRIALLGAGLTGVEFAAALRSMADRRCEAAGVDREAFQVALYEQSARLVPECRDALGERLGEALERLGVSVRTGTRVTRVDDGGLHLDRAREPADLAICCIGSRANLGRLDTDGLGDTGTGVAVNRYLQTHRDPRVFAIGDVAALEGGGALKRASEAIRQGRHVARNVQRLLEGRSLLPYRPDARVTAVSLGAAGAVIEAGPVRLGGALADRVKRHLEVSYFT